MCGIAGQVGPDSSLPQVEQMISSLRHRGPDGEGWRIAPDLVCGHRRLAIVDIARGGQPMYGCDPTIGVVYNGEIYNYKELRDQLVKLGHKFHTDCDTEVIPHIYEEYGISGYSMLDGMFAFALWTEDELHLVRDPLGIKPLYYYTDSQRITFCSEFLPLAKLLAPLPLSWDAVHSVLVYRYPATRSSILRGIWRVTPGHVVVAPRSGLPAGERPYTLRMAAEVPPTPQEIREQLMGSVRQQLMGEVPIALLLSGGLDSSIIAKCLQEARAPVTAYTIAYDNSDETPYACEVAEQCGLHHIPVVLASDEAVNDFDQLITELDEPICDPAILPLGQIADAIKRHGVRVVLSGEGADELFGGYWSYREIGAQSAHNNIERYMQISVYWPDAARWMPADTGPYHVISPIVHTATKPGCWAFAQWDLSQWLAENLMAKADRTLMRRSIEGRFPFLAKEIVAAASALSSQDLWRDNGKAILKEAFPDLPQSILQRPKQGFTVPIDKMVHSSWDRIHATIQQAPQPLHFLDRIVGAAGTLPHAEWRCWSAWVLAAWSALHADLIKTT